MSPVFHHLLIPFLVAMFLAVNMGDSGTAPSFAVAFGSGVIRRNLIPGLFGIMVFLGAVIAGKTTATTIGTEIIQPKLLNYTVTTVILFSVSLSLFFANILGIPQSTSQAAVFIGCSRIALFSRIQQRETSVRNNTNMVHITGHILFHLLFYRKIHIQSAPEKRCVHVGRGE